MAFTDRFRREDLTRPARSGGGLFGAHFDPDRFGQFSEGIARFLGTARFLVGQTIIVILWIIVNVIAVSLRWDPYPFILLNLAFSTQAAYAAPLILLAQNRQDERDRAQAERDRDVNNRTQAEAEFLARELATVRITLSGVVTVEEFDSVMNSLTGAIERIETKLDDLLSVTDAPSMPDDGSS
jgi:uncharacterized membrane protein